MSEPKISICIPVYQKPEYVIRAIQSIAKQDHKNVEIILSDDSPSSDLKLAIQPYISELDIKYYHNQPALKSPINWNNALDKATGDFYMLLHQDDWLESDKALSIFLKAFSENPSVGFVFCKNTAIQPDGQIITLQAIPSLLMDMSKRPHHILRANVIGPPSNTMLRKGIQIRYDESYIWLVDVDYYIQLLTKGYQYHYLDQHLVSIGLHEDQTTVFCRNNEDVIVKENIWFAHKLGNAAFNDVLIYDYYWRLLRNYSIRSIADLNAMGVENPKILWVIRKMLNVQMKFPLALLKIGPISKLLMFSCYLARPKNK
ncbi:MAG: glycosyltransferase family 2 protein [Sediminibacterium sp.]